MHCILSIIVLNVTCRVEGDGIRNRVSRDILRKHEDPRVKLYASDFLTGKMCNGMGHDDQSVYRGPPEARGAILNPPARHPQSTKWVSME
jgi:hypothetical protein